MQATLDQSHSASRLFGATPEGVLRPAASHWVSLGQNHGYRFEGDTAILNAELAIEPVRQHELDRGEHWALQLWACDAPYHGGPLSGIKVAEAALLLGSDRERDYLETAAFLQPPPAQRDYSMVLVLASGAGGTYDQVHDFSNYPARQQFVAPHLDGSVGYRIEGDEVVLQAEGVRNPRDVDNISGSLSLELWALHAPYAGGSFEGVLLGCSELDRLSGQSEARGIEHRVPLAQAPAGTWQLALMLREWTEAAGYITRDFCNFAGAYRVPAAVGAEPGAVPSAHAPIADAAVTSTDVVVQQPILVLTEAEPAAPAAPAAPAVALQAVATEIEPATAVPPAAPVVEPTTVAIAERAPAPSKVASTVVTARSEPASKVSKVAPQARKTAAPVTRSTSAENKAEQSATSPAVETARVSVQTGSIDDLAAVPGLNKKLAAAIVRARPFTSLDELRRVRGIGDKMLQQLRVALTV